MNTFLKTSSIILMIGIMLSVSLASMGCSDSNEIKITHRVMARDAVLDYLDKHYDGNTPDLDLAWQEENEVSTGKVHQEIRI